MPVDDTKKVNFARQKGKKQPPDRVSLHPKMSLDDFRSLYWMKEELLSFARMLGLSTRGYKPELTTRIELWLQGAAPEPTRRPVTGPRDSDKLLSRNTPVIHYKSDDKTREFFKSQIGPEFHFTYHLNQYRLAHKELTYGDLVDEWIAERLRRQDPLYQPAIAEHGKYNCFIRDFFADEQNKGKSMRDAASAWNQIKPSRGTHRYKPALLRDSEDDSE